MALMGFIQMTLKQIRMQKLDKITYDDIIVNGLKVMDTSACALCKQNNIPIVVFDFDAKDAITGILQGKEIGTYIN